MKRNFSDETKNEILKCLNRLEDTNNTWYRLPKVVDSTLKYRFPVFYAIASYIITFLIRRSDDPSDAMLKTYYTLILNQKKSSEIAIKNIFEMANRADQSYAAKAGNIIECGNKIIKEIGVLKEMATPQTITHALTYTMPDGLYYQNDPELSDQELVDYINEIPSTRKSEDYWLELISDGNEAVAGIDAGVMAAVVAFQSIGTGCEILSQVEIDSYKAAMIEQMKQYILNGEEGYDTVREIAEKTGCSEEMVRKYLQEGMVRGGQLGEEMVSFDEMIEIKRAAIDAIVMANVIKMLSNPDQFKKFCKDRGIKEDPDQLRAYLNAQNDPDYSTYEKRLYQKTVAEAVERACKEEEPEYRTLLKDTKEILSAIKKGYSNFKDDTVLGDKLKQMWKNGILSDAEARAFLKNELGFAEATQSQISALRGITENLESLGSAMKILDYGGKAADAITYLFADYSKEREMIALMKKAELAAHPDGSTYLNALIDLEAKYTDSTMGKIGQLGQAAAEYGIEKAIKSVPGLRVVETVVDTVGEITGGSDFSEAALGLLPYSQVCSSALETYEYYIDQVRTSDPANVSAEVLQGVRQSYAVLKNTLEDYYKTNITYYQGMKNGAYTDLDKAAYYTNQLDKIKKMKLGDTFDYVSYDQYIANMQN